MYGFRHAAIIITSLRKRNACVFQNLTAKASGTNENFLGLFFSVPLFCSLRRKRNLTSVEEQNNRSKELTDILMCMGEGNSLSPDPWRVPC